MLLILFSISCSGGSSGTGSADSVNGTLDTVYLSGSLSDLDGVGTTASTGDVVIYLSSTTGDPVLDNDGQPIEIEVGEDGTFEIVIPADSIDLTGEAPSIILEAFNGATARAFINLDGQTAEDITIDLNSTMAVLSMEENTTATASVNASVSDAAITDEMVKSCSVHIMNWMAQNSTYAPSVTLGYSMASIMALIETGITSGVWLNEYQPGELQRYIEDIIWGVHIIDEIPDTFLDSLLTVGAEAEHISVDDITRGYIAFTNNFQTIQETLTTSFIPNLRTAIEIHGLEIASSDTQNSPISELCSDPDVIQILLEFHPAVFGATFSSSDVADFQYQALREFEDENRNLPDGMAKTIAGAIQGLGTRNENYTDTTMLFNQLEFVNGEIPQTSDLENKYSRSDIVRTYIGSCIQSTECRTSINGKPEDILGLMLALAGSETTFSQTVDYETFLAEIKSLTDNAETAKNENDFDPESCLTDPSGCQFPAATIFNNIALNNFEVLSTGVPLDQNMLSTIDGIRNTAPQSPTQQPPQQQPPQQQPPQQQPPQQQQPLGTQVVVNSTFPASITNKPLVVKIGVENTFSTVFNASQSSTANGTTATNTFPSVPAGSIFAMAWVDMNSDNIQNAGDFRGWAASNNDMFPNSPTVGVPRPGNAPVTITLYAIPAPQQGGGGGNTQVIVNATFPSNLTNKPLVVKIGTNNAFSTPFNASLSSTVSGTTANRTFASVPADNYFVMAWVDINGDNIQNSGDLRGWANSNNDISLNSATVVVPRPGNAPVNITLYLVN